MFGNCIGRMRLDAVFLGFVLINIQECLTAAHVYSTVTLPGRDAHPKTLNQQNLD